MKSRLERERIFCNAGEGSPPTMREGIATRCEGLVLLDTFLEITIMKQGPHPDAESSSSYAISAFPSSLLHNFHDDASSTWTRLRE